MAKKEEKPAAAGGRILKEIKGAKIVALFLVLAYTDGTTETFALHSAEGLLGTAPASDKKADKKEDKAPAKGKGKKDDDDDDDEDEDDDEDDEDEDDDEDDEDEDDDDDDEDEDEKPKKGKGKKK